MGRRRAAGLRAGLAAGVVGLVTLGGSAVGGAASASAASPAAVVSGPARPVGSTAPVAAARPAPTGSVIVRFAPGTPAAISSAARDRALAAAGRKTDVDLAARRRLGGGATLVTGASPAQATQVAAALGARPDVVFAEPDVVLHPADASSGADERSDVTVAAAARALAQWDLGTAGVGAPAAWSVTRGQGAVVAVVDSGLVTHPEFAGRVLPGYDFISDPDRSRDGDGRDADPTDAGDWQAAGECSDDRQARPSEWHGTHVAGTIAAADDGAGTTGVAPLASIEPVRVTGRCGGVLSDLLDAMTWASGGAVAGVPANAHPADVLNVSLGGSGACSPALQSVVDDVIARGSVVVTAAGNSGADADRSTPGDCRGVVDVAATDGDGGPADYSNRGSVVALSAPGGSSRSDAIVSTIDRGTRGPVGPSYGPMVGTSMAAPHVTGVVALLRAARPDLTPAQVRAALVASARPFGQRCVGCGSGIVDAAAALARVGAGPAGDATDPSGDTTGAPEPAPATPVLRAAAVGAAVPTGAAALATWSGAAGTTYEVQVRSVTRSARGARTTGEWATAARVTANSTLLPARRGTVLDVRVRAASGASGEGASGEGAWSAPVTLAVPLDVTASATHTGRWTQARSAAAVGGTLLTSTARGASATFTTSGADGVGLIVGRSRAGGRADVYVDGRLATTVSTAARTTSAAVTGALLPLRYGRHTVTIVVRSGAVALDGIAFTS